MILASSLGKFVHPLFVAFAWLLAEFYSVIPNYAVAIALLTIAVMIVVFPITRRGTRSMMKMQILAPELKSLQTKYKAKPGMTTTERQELRQKLNEEMMAFYKENGASPTGGCLPMFLQFPIFWILYATIRGLTHEVTLHGRLVVQPLYISHATRLYHDISHGGSKLPAFGLKLADSVKTHGLSGVGRVPYVVMILIAIALQYIQMKQLSGRNPAAAQANPQMQQMQKFMPLIFAVIYISIPAGVNVYFIVSSLFRIGQQEFMYRHDPQLKESMEKLRHRAKNDPKVIAARAVANQQSSATKGLLARLRPAALMPDTEPAGAAGANAAPPGGTAPKRPPAKGPNGAGSGTPARRANTNRKPGGAAGNGATATAPKSQPRAQGKRARRPR